MKKYDYKKLPPFKGMVLQNFPFIEEDFDAITNYELLCKVVEYLNIIAKNNDELIDNINALNEFFDNLNLQEEVNNKLDEMASDGTLKNLLDNVLNIVTVYNTTSDMMSAKSTFVNGMKITVLSDTTLNDGGGYTFIVTNVSTNADIDFENGLYGKYLINVYDNYIDNITVEKARHYDTDCYITKIPLNDKYGNLIEPYVAKGNGKTPTEYARDNFTTLTINASSYITDMEDAQLSGVPIMIGNGVVLNNNPMISEGVSDDILYLGFTADRSIIELKVNETSLERLQSYNLINVFDVYYKLIENSTALDLTGVRIKGSNDIVTIPAPRQCIGVKSDGTLIILTCDGRFTNNIGLTSAETQQILLDLGCVNAWNIDGGGSSSTTYKGSKVNRNIDGNGTIDRNIPYTLNFKRKTVNEEVAKIYSFLGKEKQDLLGQLVLNSVQYQNITSRDLDELVGNPIIGYGNALLNTPYAPNLKAGYFINICHSGTSNIEFKQLYNCQFYYERDLIEGYTRRQVNGVFTPWEKINGDTTNAYNTGGNIIISGSDYENIPFAINDTTVIVGDTETMVGGKYINFKIKKVGHYKITIVADIVPKTADGDRYIRILKNNGNVVNIRQYGVVNQGEVITFSEYNTNDSVDNLFSFEYKGQEDDVILRFRAIIETK